MQLYLQQHLEESRADSTNSYPFKCTSNQENHTEAKKNLVNPTQEKSTVYLDWLIHRTYICNVVTLQLLNVYPDRWEESVEL